jgi:lipoate-protein ligase A
MGHDSGRQVQVGEFPVEVGGGAIGHGCGVILVFVIGNDQKGEMYAISRNVIGTVLVAYRLSGVEALAQVLKQVVSSVQLTTMPRQYTGGGKTDHSTCRRTFDLRALTLVVC